MTSTICSRRGLHAPHTMGTPGKKIECPGAGDLLASLKPDTWIIDADMHGPHPVQLAYCSEPFTTGDGHFVTAVFLTHSTPVAMSLPADQRVTLATDDQVKARKSVLTRQRMAGQLRHIADLITEPGLPLSHDTIVIHGGSVDRTELHRIAGIVGAEIRPDYSVKDGQTQYSVVVGDSYPGACIRWEARWPDADPCADGCSDPAAHAEGGHDV